MEAYRITGGVPLQGSVSIQGAKNAALPLLAASLLCESCELHNCPYLTDTDAACKILESLGGRTERTGDTVWVGADKVNACAIPERLMHAMRSSIVFLGAIVARCGHGRVSLPGGCELGARPIDLHLFALERLGVHITEEGGCLECSVPHGLRGAVIPLAFPSVGATENALIAACLAKGTTVLKNAAREPEIEDLIRFLNAAGAKISTAPQGDIYIEGVTKLSGCSHRVIPDRIVAATCLCAAAATGGDVELHNVCPEHLGAVLPCFEEMGCVLTQTESSLRLRRSGSLFPLHQVRTMPYPGFPTDAQSPLMAAACVANGTSVFVENIFESRYKQVGELCRMGADISVEGRVAVVRGVPRLHGAKLQCTDLRGGAALAVAALAAEGESMLAGIQHIHRGYVDFAGLFKQLGGSIRPARILL